MSDPVLTSTQWKGWAAAFLPLSPPPSLRSLMLQLNHALRNPEVTGLSRDLYFLEGGQAYNLTFFHLPNKSMHLIYPFSYDQH